MASLTIGFELSNLCNLHCTHCIRGSWQDSIDHLDLGLFASILDQAATKFDTLVVVFTGGEPLASVHFPAAVTAAVERAIPYRLVTNGWLLPAHLGLLVRHPPQFTRVSLSGATERTHDQQRGKGSFRRALLGAAAMMSRGLRTELSMVITRFNVDELPAAISLANDLGVAEFHFILPQPTPESAAEGSDLSPDEWDAASARVRSLAVDSSVLIGLDYGARDAMPRQLCGTLAQRQVYVDALGRVPFCCQLSRYGTGAEPILGDLTRESLDTVMARAGSTYADFTAHTVHLHQIGRWDRSDDYPCLSCARRHGRTGFLADYPQHPWAALAAGVA